MALTEVKVDIHNSLKLPGITIAQISLKDRETTLYADPYQGFEHAGVYIPRSQLNTPLVGKAEAISLEQSGMRFSNRGEISGPYSTYRIKFEGSPHTTRVLRPFRSSDNRHEVGEKNVEFWLLKHLLKEMVDPGYEELRSVYLQHEVSNYYAYLMIRLETLFGIQMAETRDKARQCIKWLKEERPKSEWWTPYKRLERYDDDVRIFYIADYTGFKAAVTLIEVTPEENCIPWIYVTTEERNQKYGTALLYQALLYTAYEGKKLLTFNTNTQRGHGGSEKYYRRLFGDPALYRPTYTENDPAQAGVWWYLTPNDYLDRMKDFISSEEKRRQHHQRKWLTYSESLVMHQRTKRVIRPVNVPGLV